MILVTFESALFWIACDAVVGNGTFDSAVTLIAECCFFFTKGPHAIHLSFESAKTLTVGESSQLLQILWIYNQDCSAVDAVCFCSLDIRIALCISDAYFCLWEAAKLAILFSM